MQRKYMEGSEQSFIFYKVHLFMDEAILTHWQSGSYLGVNVPTQSKCIFQFDEKTDGIVADETKIHSR